MLHADQQAMTQPVCSRCTDVNVGVGV